METLFSKTKIAHSRRVFCKSTDMKKKLTRKKFSYSIKTNHQQNVLEFVNWYKNYYLKK